MYQKEDVVVYENAGVCRIVDICSPDFVKTGEMYYKLQPLDDNGGTIYYKVNSDKLKIRPVMTSEEAGEFLEAMEEMDGTYESDNKSRESEYCRILKSCDCRSWFGMFKGIEDERKRRALSGKKLNSNDDKYLQKAGRFLVAELSHALQVEPGEVERRIRQAV